MLDRLAATVHDSRAPRHAFITAALDAGVPLRDVQEAASHADPRTTMRYDREAPRVSWRLQVLDPASGSGWV